MTTLERRCWLGSRCFSCKISAVLRRKNLWKSYFRSPSVAKDLSSMWISTGRTGCLRDYTGMKVSRCSKATKAPVVCRAGMTEVDWVWKPAECKGEMRLTLIPGKIACLEGPKAVDGWNQGEAPDLSLQLCQSIRGMCHCYYDCTDSSKALLFLSYQGTQSQEHTVPLSSMCSIQGFAADCLKTGNLKLVTVVTSCGKAPRV